MSTNSAEKPYVPIACDLYDQVEVVCMHKYDIEVFAQNATIRGTAEDTRVSSGVEYLILRLPDGTTETVRLDMVTRVVVLSEPRHFDEIILNDQ